MQRTVFVYLPDEAVDAWRPVAATHLREDRYLLSGPVPEGETWEFQPGEIVRCREQKFEDGTLGTIAFACVPEQPLRGSRNND